MIEADKATQQSMVVMYTYDEKVHVIGDDNATAGYKVKRYQPTGGWKVEECIVMIAYEG